MNIVGSLFGHPASSSERWANGPRGTPDPDLSEGWGEDGACFLTGYGVITACHLVATNTWCYVNDEQADAIRRWPDEDVALVRALAPGLQPLLLAGSLPAIGETVTWYGLDDNWRQESHQVHVMAVSQDRIEISWAPSKMGPGDSGAPCLNAAGQVIGMMIREVRYRVEGRTEWCAVLVPSTVILGLVAQDGKLFEP